MRFIGKYIDNNAKSIVIKLVIIILLCVVFIQAVTSMRLESPTFDEIAHLPAGYFYLKTGDFSLNVEHPPLIKMIAALSLLFLPVRMPDNHPTWKDEWQFGKQFFYQSNKNADQILFWGRMPLVLISLLLGFFVFKWAKELYGDKAGLFALFLYAFEPNILAHSRYVTVDLGVAFFIFLAIYQFWKFTYHPSRINLLFAGIALGLALASKFSAVVLIPIYLLFAFLARIKYKRIWSLQKSLPPNSKSESVKKVPFSFAALLLIFSIAFLIIVASYGLQFKPLSSPFSRHETLKKFIPDNVFFKKTIYYWAENIPIPAQEYLTGLNFVIAHNRSGHPAFLLGKHSIKGWWYYFIVAFMIKTPIPLLLLIIVSILFFRKYTNLSKYNEIFLILPVVVIFVTSSFSQINIGLRHILPIYPLLFVFMSKITNLKFKRQKTIASIALGLSAWYVISSLTIYPHYLAYFNEFVGGPNNGYKYLVDSNLDWGQDLKGLARYVKEKKIKKIKLSYFGNTSPDYYRIPYELVTEKEMHQYTPGIYAISATNLQNVYADDKTRFAWLKKYKPENKVGYSIFVYNIPP